jgi:hypothetical protein
MIYCPHCSIKSLRSFKTQAFNSDEFARKIKKKFSFSSCHPFFLFPGQRLVTFTWFFHSFSTPSLLRVFIIFLKRCDFGTHICRTLMKTKTRNCLRKWEILRNDDYSQSRKATRLSNPMDQNVVFFSSPFSDFSSSHEQKCSFMRNT